MTVSTALCSIFTFLILSTRSEDGSSRPLQAMGYWPLGLRDTLRSLLLVALLFSGPLYESLVFDGLWKDWLVLRPLLNVWYEWTSWRNLVAVSLARLDPVATRSAQLRRGIDRLYVSRRAL